MIKTDDFVVVLFSFGDGFFETPDVGVVSIQPLGSQKVIKFLCVVLRRDQFIMERKFLQHLDSKLITRVPTLYEAIQFSKYEKLSRL